MSDQAITIIHKQSALDLSVVPRETNEWIDK